MNSANSAEPDHEAALQNIANNVSDAHVGKMFGASCIKVTNGKAAAILWKNVILFKLNAKDQKEALSLDGASLGFHLYAPEKPMRGWVAIPDKHFGRWSYFAKKAVKFTLKAKK